MTTRKPPAGRKRVRTPKRPRVQIDQRRLVMNLMLGGVIEKLEGGILTLELHEANYLLPVLKRLRQEKPTKTVLGFVGRPPNARMPDFDDLSAMEEEVDAGASMATVAAAWSYDVGIEPKRLAEILSAFRKRHQVD